MSAGSGLQVGLQQLREIAWRPSAMLVGAFYLIEISTGAEAGAQRSESRADASRQPGGEGVSGQGKTLLR